MNSSKTGLVRRRKTSGERQRLLARFRKSQMTQQDFAIRHGIGMSTLSKWLRVTQINEFTPAAWAKRKTGHSVSLSQSAADVKPVVPVPNKLQAALRHIWPAGCVLHTVCTDRRVTGLRTAELLRLDWADVWRVAGHIEITAGKSKTRQRRLVEICPALAAWLEPYRIRKNGKLWTQHAISFQHAVVALCEQADVKRKTNGLRHSFCSYHFALHANENLTATQAGNSPAMIHGHYKGLATKAEAEKWFDVMPDAVPNVISLSAWSRDPTLQGFSPKLAKGEIASLSGAADDPKYFQISVPVQPGNSGGALVDAHGNVVGKHFVCFGFPPR